MTGSPCEKRSEDIAHGLVRRAAQRAPEELSQRLAEEWLADLAERRGRLSRVFFGLGCCWATRVIARDYEPACVSAGVGEGRVYPSGLSLSGSAHWRRPAAFLLAAALHVAVFFAFLMGLHPGIRAARITDIQNISVPATPKSYPPLPHRTFIDQTKWTSLKLDISPPLLRESNEEPGQLTPRYDEGGFVSPPLQPPQPDPPPVIKRLNGGPGSNFPSPDDFYPSLSVHLGETGAATVKVCVDAKGRLTALPAIEQSSGSMRLDGAAVNLAKAGSGHYRPSTDDGRPVDSCYAFRVRFNLRN